MALTERNPHRGTRLSKRDAVAYVVHRAAWQARDAIAEPRNILGLRALASYPGEVIAVAVADLCADGVIHASAGLGRLVVEEPQP